MRYETFVLECQDEEGVELCIRNVMDVLFGEMSTMAETCGIIQRTNKWKWELQMYIVGRGKKYVLRDKTKNCGLCENFNET